MKRAKVLMNFIWLFINRLVLVIAWKFGTSGEEMRKQRKKAPTIDECPISIDGFEFCMNLTNKDAASLRI